MKRIETFDRPGMRMSLIYRISFIALCSCVCQTALANGYRTPEQAGVENVVLFYYDPPRRNFETCRSLADAFLPYVGYIDSHGRIADTFFDGVVLIDLKPFVKNPAAATKERWGKYITKTFKVWPVGQKPVLSQPGYLSDHSVQIPYRNACIHQDLISAKDGKLTLTLHTRVENMNDERDDGYVGVAVFDRLDRPIRQGVTGLTYSTYLGIWYRYVNADTSWQERRIQFRLPPDAVHFSTFLGSWHTPGIYYDNVRLSGGMLIEGGFEGGGSGWKGSDFPKPTLQYDSSAILVALDRAARAVSERLEYPEMKMKVILTIPWDRRSHLQARFGGVDGSECDLRKPADATRAVKWFVRTCHKEWQSLKPERLELAGFYWLNEKGNDSDKVIFPGILNYVHELGYRLYASPYPSYWRRRPSMGKEYVSWFDCLWLQPNAWPPDPQGKRSKHFYSVVKRAYDRGWLAADSTWVRNNGIPLEELREAEIIAESLNMGINMEWSGGQEVVKGYGRILDYINRDGSLPHDFTEASHLFYDDGGFGWYCCYSDSAVFREQYDAVYRFVKQAARR